MRVDMYTPDLTRIGTLPALAGEMVLTLDGIHKWDLAVDATTSKWARFGKDCRVRVSDEHCTYLSGQASQIGTDITRTGARTVALVGESDEVVLDEMICLPTPNQPVAEQDTQAAYQAEGPAETVMRDLIRKHIGPDAQPMFRVPHLSMRPDQARGKTVKVNAQFTPLLDELGELAKAGGVHYRITQEGRELVVEFYEGRDLSRAVRLTRQGGAIGQTSLSQSRPAVTQVIIAGQGQRVAHKVIAVTRDPGAWGRRITRFKSDRSTNDVAELEQAANVELDDGQETAAARVEVSDTASKRFGRDFWLGDTLTLHLGGGDTITDVLTEATVKWGPKGRTVELNVGPKLPSPDDPSWVDPVDRIFSRLRNLERT